MKNTDTYKKQWLWSTMALSVIVFLLGIQGLKAQQLAGQANAEVGIGYTYQIQWSPVNSPVWEAVGGTISPGASQTASITWNQTGSYFVRVSFSDGSSSYNLELPVTVTDPPPPPPQPVEDDNGCGQATIKVTGTLGTGVTWYWQGKSSSSTIKTKGSGSTFALDEGDGIYYIKAEKNGEWSDAVASDYITIADLTAGTLTDEGTLTICHGDNPPSLGSSSLAGGTEGIYSYQWEYSSFDSGGWVEISGAQAEGYAPPGTLTADRSYRRKVTCGTQTATTGTVDIIVHPLVLAPGVTHDERCGTGTVQLSASPGSNADQIRWYSASTGGSEITTGVSGNTLTLTTGSLTADATYYAESYDNGTGCFSSSRTAVQATIDPVPGLATASDPLPQCGPSIFTFSATPGSNGNSIKWYTAASGGTLKHEGTDYLTPTTLPIGATTYYAASFDDLTLCEDTDRVAVTATVYAIPGIPTIGSQNPATCSDLNGSFIIEGYNGTLYDYALAPSAGVIWGGATVTAPGGLYTLTVTTKGSNCSTSLPVDLRNLSGPFAPLPPQLTATAPVCVNAKGKVYIDDYSIGYDYTITSTTGVPQSEISPISEISPNTWMFSAPSGTYEVTRRELTTNCVSSIETVTVDTVSTTCTSAHCSIDLVSTVDTLNFTSIAQNIPWTIVGNTNCPLVVTQKPDWIVSAEPQQDNATIPFISEANTFGDREGTIQVQQTGGHIITITVYQEHHSNYPGNPDPPVIDPNDCSQRTLTASPPGDEAWFWQGKNDQSMSETLPATDPYIVDEADGDGYYYIRAKKNGYWSTKATGVYVTIKSVPEDPNALISQPQCLTETGTITVTNADPGDEISFDGGVTYGTTSSMSGFAAGDHVIMLRSADGCVSAGVTATINQAPSVDCGPVTYTGDNYIYSRTYQKENPGTATAFFTQDADLIQQITYFDGLGRPEQQIGIDQSPTTGTDWNDIVTHIDYDGYGRQDKEFLPYVATDANLGVLRTGAESATTTFYNVTKYENTSNPYSQKAFEASPLSLVTRQAAPGAAWMLDLANDDHSIEFGYLTNMATDNVRQFVLTTNLVNDIYVPTLTFEQDDSSNDIEYYKAGELYKTITRDENHSGTTKNHTTEEFKDKQGRVVLKRTYADIPAMDRNGNGNTIDPGEEAVPQAPHDTYYVYDDFGNLTYVLPPKMEASTAALTDINNTMNELGYQYVYDHRNRLVEKRIPGKEWEYIVYNKMDQPIMTQDANQRDKDANSDEWLFTKYDAFGRVAYTGKATSSEGRSRTDIQTEVDGLTDALWVIQSDAYSNFGGTDVYYDNEAYPTDITTQATLLEVLTINYYDNYDFMASETGMSLPSTVFEIDVENHDYTEDIKTKGLATGGKVKVLDVAGSNNWITIVTGYDEKGSGIYGQSKNAYLGTEDTSFTLLDFTGKLVKTKTVHVKNGITIATIDNFTYDHVGRLLAQNQCIGDETLDEVCPGGSSAPINPVYNTPVITSKTDIATTSITLDEGFHVVATANLSYHAKIDPNITTIGGERELIVLNEYDNLGQLKWKKVGGTSDGVDVLQSNGLQQVDYTYNVRGWLTDINDITDVTPDKLFNFSIGYNQGTNPLYNGNISNTQWRTDNLDKVLKSYDYVYDALNRITAASDNTGNYDVSNISYDKMGNLLSLSRKGHTTANPELGYDDDGDGQDDHYGDMDILKYGYHNNEVSNKLYKVKDSGNSTYGFKDSAVDDQDYWYDANGNMISDTNKGITNIEYNHLNLPVQVTFGSDNIQYIYDATGVKLKKTVSTGGTTEYAGNYIYENDLLQFFNHAEGTVSPKDVNDYSVGFDYVYNYFDHLGNVRLSYTDANNDGDIAQNEIVAENNYYPFGLTHKGYNNNISPLGNSKAKDWKYGEEEFEEDLGKNTVAYQWRDYDPAIGRFNKVDRFAEKYVDASPYSYVTNNPIHFREVKGDSILVYFNGKDGKRLNSIPKAVQQMFQDEFGISVGYNSDTNMLYLDGEVDSELSQSESATGLLVEALTDTNTGKKSDKHGTIKFGYNLSAIKNGSNAVSGGDWTTTGGIYRKGVTQIDLADFDSSGKSNLFTYNSNRISRSFGLARTFEHEYLGHQRLRSSGFGDGSGYNMGRVVRSTNQFNRERGIPERLNYYSSGYIFFGSTGGYSSRRAQADAVRKMVNKPSSNELFIKRNSRKN